MAATIPQAKCSGVQSLLWQPTSIRDFGATRCPAMRQAAYQLQEPTHWRPIMAQVCQGEISGGTASAAAPRSAHGCGRRPDAGTTSGQGWSARGGRGGATVLKMWMRGTGSEVQRDGRHASRQKQGGGGDLLDWGEAVPHTAGLPGWPELGVGPCCAMMMCPPSHYSPDGGA